MNPHQRLTWTLALSLIIWAPVALGIIGGRIDVTKGCLIYVGALLFSWAGTGIIERITNNYRETQEAVYRAKQEVERIERRAQRQAEQAEKDSKAARRASDD